MPVRFCPRSLLCAGVLVVLTLSGCSGGSVSSSTGASGSTGAPSAGSITVTPVSYAQLQEAIATHKGKVVVIDFWADWCTTCKEEFPHLVELHHKYAPQGLVCMSLTLDDKEGEPGALRFLVKSKATFPNYRYEDKEEWGDRFEMKGPPAVFVYGRDGKLARRFDSNDPSKHWTYQDVEAEVTKQLAVQP